MSAIDPNGGSALLVPPASGGLPAGGTPADVLTGDGAWTSHLAVCGDVLGVPRVLPLCAYATTDGPLTAVGRLRFDPALYAVDGLTLTLTLEVMADVSAGGLTGTVTLYDLTAAAAVATLTWTTETTPAAKTASVTVPGAAHDYELRAALTGGEGYLTLGAVLRLTWS